MTTASDLRAVVARRVGLNRKVAVLGSDAALLKTIESNGCTVLADPESLEAIAAFGPQVVVAFDGFAKGGDFGALVKAAPGAELVFSFANAASSSALLQTLIGKPSPQGLAEPEVRGWLTAAGLQVVSRDVVVGPHQPTGLAVDAEAQLRALLEQLNPDAGAERLLLVARRTPAEPAVPREPGLLSVLVSAGEDLSALLGTLASLAGQPQRPMQVVIATSGPPGEAERAGRQQAERGSFAVEVVASSGADFAARTNQALPRARGQYLAFLEAGDTVERVHYRQLIHSLERGASAWAISHLKQPGVPLPQSAFCLPDALATGATARCALLLDRDRLGPFPLSFAEGVAEAEPLFLARLAALFPAITSGGQPTVERPTAGSPFDPAALAQAMKARPLRAIGPLMLGRLEPAAEPGLPLQLRRWLKKI